MARNRFYWFTFEDGYQCCTRGYSAAEMRAEVREHGRLISQTLAS